ASVVDQNGGVLVEPDVGAVLPLRLLGRSHDHRLGDVALLHLTGGNRVLDGDYHGIAESGVTPLTPAEHPDHKRTSSTRIVGDAKDGFLLNHGYFALSTISVTRYRTVLASGRVSMIRTVSPALAPRSLRA